MFDELKIYIKSLDDNAITKHNIYSVLETDILKVENKIEIPYELKLFYLEVGYGFFHKNIGESFRLFGPHNFQQINLKEDFYEFDPDLDIYDQIYNGDKLLFFEVFGGNYLAIDKEDFEGKNKIFHYDKKIANSLEEFLIELDKKPNYFDD
ncbi:SMI1/KNR4 family protein [Agrobacterium tumefaciens]|nr:SMI1/KNR4 family protein [Agrobacterium tumefaciens]NTE18092.1 SMI1/KNR4 family protein [Agrobacterium tumefaciens]